MTRWLAVLLLAIWPACARAQCPNVQNFATTAPIVSAGNTQLLPAPGIDTNTGKLEAIHICAITIQVSQGTTSANFGLTAGTGSNCAVGNTVLLPDWFGAPSTLGSFGQVYPGTIMPVPPGVAVCLHLSASPVGAMVHLLYAIE